MKVKEYDFSGWATKTNIKCSDGRVILKDAFAHNDGDKVPLVWNHQHSGPENILGFAILENYDNGVYAKCKLNNTPAGRNAKLLIEHGDISSLSIFANELEEANGNVSHGNIREVSLVLAGANPGAYIDTVLAHNDGTDDSALIYNDEESLELYHADKEDPPEEETKGDKMKTENKETKKEKTIGEVFNTFTEEQKNVVYALIAMVLDEEKESEDSEDKKKESEDSEDKKKEDKTEENKGEKKEMKHNVFDNENENEDNKDVLKHGEILEIIDEAKRGGSMKDAFLAHGINDVEYLFPEAKATTLEPVSVKRDTGWVSEVMGAVHKTPFSRIKSLAADLTEDEARAKGYIKGKEKKDEVFGMLKRTTQPVTIYKKQKLERDDVADITDFDVVMWLKREMRGMLEEEIARAILVSDGRSASSDDKINEQNIRPIWKDEDLYAIKKVIEVSAEMTEDDQAKEFIRTAVRSRKEYKGSGDPTLYVTEDMLTKCLLMEDKTGRVVYDSIDKLATAMRVSKIVAVPVMENLTREVSGANHKLEGIIVNLADYNVGADKGGAVNMFDDFDIDFNAYKYLIETRCSGALVQPYSAIVIETTVPAAG